STGTRIVLQVSGGVAQVAVPNVRGQLRADAETNLPNAGFTNIQFVSADGEGDPGVGPSEVIGTEPPAGSMQARDTPITVLLNPEAGPGSV
ncbi:PASTA domain-containing protein, partial [Enterococcus faecium]